MTPAERTAQWRRDNPERAREHVLKKLADPVKNRERVKAHRLANPRMYRSARLQRDYGITLDEYEAMQAAQGGGCALCGCVDQCGGRGNTLHVDHDHQTGKVRGLLCHRCNTGLGLFREDPDLLSKAAAYLR